VILVFDSSVWVSALKFGGIPLQALDLARGRFRIALNQPILVEIHATLARKFQWTVAEIDEAFAVYAVGTVIVQTSGRLQGICRDPKDDMVLECAVIAGADLIVTGDKDLLIVGNYQGIRILTSRQFLDKFTVSPAD
jgi:putative PIN family toxin of toxin-antitoxin system